jgi:hypothetical protein
MQTQAALPKRKVSQPAIVGFCDGCEPHQIRKNQFVARAVEQVVFFCLFCFNAIRLGSTQELEKTADMNRMGDPYYHPRFDCLSTGGSIVNYNICHPKFNERGTKSNQSKGNK